MNENNVNVEVENTQVADANVTGDTEIQGVAVTNKDGGKAVFVILGVTVLGAAGYFGYKGIKKLVKRAKSKSNKKATVNASTETDKNVQ